MSDFIIKGETFDKRVKRLYSTCTAINIARAAKPGLIAAVSGASQTLASNIKEKTVSKDEAHLYINEKSLQFPNMVPGNKKPNPIGSNKLAGILNKGTPAHIIAPKKTALHFIGAGMGVGGHVFLRKPVNHPGTTGKDFWKVHESMKDAIGKMVDTNLKTVFSK